MVKQFLPYVLILGFFGLISASVSGQCVGDTTKPFFERCPQNIVVSQSSANPNDCIPLEWSEPLAADDCGIASLTSNRVSGECFALGVTTIVYTAIDSSQNSATCSFTITVLPSNPCVNDTTKPVINCPSNMVLTSNDSCAVAQWTVPTASDNCTTPSVSSNFQSGFCFPLGITDVIYTAIDSNTNAATCSFSVTVESPCARDTTKPVFANCPGNISLTTSGPCAAAQWIVPTVSDNCGSVSTFATAQPGRCFNVGVSNVTYRATDLAGNAAICTFAVNVSSPCAVDTIKPTLVGCPANIVLTTYDSCAIATWTPATATDNCNIASVIPSQQPGTCFPVGTTTVIYTARDAKNNASTCSFTVSVTNLCAGDTIKPVIANCPANITLTTADSCAIAQWNAPTITDNCGTPTLTASHGSASCFPVGTTVVMYSGRDNRNNTALCSFSVTVRNACFNDSIAPVFTNCPANITLTTTDTCAVAQWVAPKATDNCGTPSVSSNFSAGRCFPVGTTRVLYTARDARGNVKECAFTVTIVKLTSACANDFTKPTLTRCPSNINLVSIDSCTFVGWTPPTATDNCGTPTVSGSREPNTCFKQGVTNIVYTARDGNNNVATCTFNVTVTKPCANDSIKPRFPFCPSDITVTTYDSCAKATWVTPVATDNCSSATVTSAYTSGTCFKVGVRTVVYTAKDLNNNSATCSFKVTITNPCLTDVTKPVIRNCPANITLNTADSCAVATWTKPTVTDNCGTPTMTASHISGACFKVGSTTVSYYARDTRGNNALCAFAVNVINPCFKDSIKPVIVNCPANIVLTTRDTCARATWTAPTATDNCGTPSVSSAFQSGECFKVGTTTVTYTARDAKGNTALCAFTVTVINPCLNDSIKPVIVNCPANIVMTTRDTCARATWTAPTATDNCSTPSVLSAFQSGACFKVGTTTVTYTAKDAKGNTALCAFTVSIVNPCLNDTIKPIIYNCPANIVQTTADTAAVVTWKTPTAIDNCGATMLIPTKTPNSLFSIGTTTVVYTATDANNNKATCTFTVTLRRVLTACSNDTVKPVFANCPANITVNTTSTNAIAQWTLPTATDNCSTPSVSAAFASGSTFSVGTTTVVLTAKDAAGNAATCSFNVTVVLKNIGLVLDSSKCYVLVSRSSKKALSIANSSTAAGAYAVQWSYFNAASQKWRINRADSNSYNLTSRQSNLNLDTRWGATTEGARLMQWSKSAASATQKWQLVPTTDGFYKVVNKGSNRAMSVNGGTAATSDGSLLIQSTYVGSTAQQWSIAEIPCASTALALTTNDALTVAANAEFNRTRIEWTDNTAYKNDYYEVQKLNPTSGNFERLDVINNKSFDNAVSYQSVYDAAPTEGDNFYRVKVVYLDSVSRLSDVKKVVFNGLETIKLFPNPANDYVDIDLSKFNNETIGVYLYNSFGKKVAFQLVQKDKFSIVHFDISNQDAGNYVMRITAHNKRDVIRQLQIVR